MHTQSVNSTFMFVVDIPSNSYEQRTIVLRKPAPRDFLFWTTKELDSRLSGEFRWVKIASRGIRALQYMNRQRVRILVEAPSADVAESMVKVFIWHLSAKKHHNAPYQRQSMKTDRMITANAIAIAQAMALVAAKSIAA